MSKKLAKLMALVAGAAVYLSCMAGMGIAARLTWEAMRIGWRVGGLLP